MLIELMLGKDKDSKEEKGRKKADDLKNVKKERDEYLDGWKRAKADLINYKKEEMKRLEEIVKFSSEDMICDLVDVIDSFELALASMRDDDPAEKGIYLIKSKFEDTLKKRGLTRMEINQGDTFDPVRHEAVGTVEKSDSNKEDTIAEEVEAGYMLHERVLRAARVKVYK